MRILIFLNILLMTLIPLASEDRDQPYVDNISRLELLGFNYFSPPLSLSPGQLYNNQGNPVRINGETQRVMLILFLNKDDPFDKDLRTDLDVLSERYEGAPFLILTVSSEEEDYKDHNRRTAEKWGVQKYPTILLIDHNFLLRGSSEGIYPDLLSEGFKQIIDELLLNIQTPGIVDTLQ
jgi:hypothetical protein